MPNIRCAVSTCKSHNFKNISGSKHFHKFPKNRPDVRRKWLYLCGIKMHSDVDSKYICSDHFNSTDYRPESGGKLLKESGKRRFHTGTFTFFRFPYITLNTCYGLVAVPSLLLPKQHKLFPDEDDFDDDEFDITVSVVSTVNSKNAQSSINLSGIENILVNEEEARLDNVECGEEEIPNAIDTSRPKHSTNLVKKFDTPEETSLVVKNKCEPASLQRPINSGTKKRLKRGFDTDSMLTYIDKETQTEGNDSLLELKQKYAALLSKCENLEKTLKYSQQSISVLQFQVKRLSQTDEECQETNKLVKY